MGNAPNTNCLLLWAGRCGTSTKRSNHRRHQGNEGKSWLEAQRVRALGALRSLGSRKKLAAEKRRETHFLSNAEKEKWIEDYVETESAGARKRVEDVEAGVQQEQDDVTHAEITGLTSREPETTSQEMLVATDDSLSDHASSDNGEDGEDEDDEETEQGKLSDDDEPGWVMGTITRTVQHRMESFQQKHLMLDELTPPGSEDAAYYFGEPHKKYGTFELWVLPVVQPRTNDDSPARTPTTFGECTESLDIVPGISQRPQGISRPGSSHIRRGPVIPLSKSSILSGEPAAEPDLSTLITAKPVEPVSFSHCIKPQADYHIGIGFRRRDGEGSCVCGRIDMQSV